MYVSRRVSGEGWILAGDAACFVDPLFSTGVHLALSSGVMAAALAHSTLKDPAIARPAGEVYQQLYYQQYSHFRELARLFYASNRTVQSYFWEARRILGDDALTPREAFVRATAGQSPRGYERSVLSHGALPGEFAGEASRLKGDCAVASRRIRRGLSQRRRPRRLPAARRGGQPPTPPRARRRRVRVGADVLTSPAWPEGVPLSTLVAWFVSRLDGSRSFRAALDEVAQRTGEHAQPAIDAAREAALRILYVDGLVEGLGEGVIAERKTSGRAPDALNPH